MNFVWNHKGPYFHAPCQRDRFPSLVDEMGESGDKLVAHLGISNMADMGARLKRGCSNSIAAEQRSAKAVRDSGVPLHELFHWPSQGMRRAVDKYAQIPKYDPHVEEEQLLFPGQPQRKLVNNQDPMPAQRQAGEPPYTGNCQHCRRRGTNDVANDFHGRLFLQHAYFLGQIDLLVMEEQPPQNEEPPNAIPNNNNED